MNAYSKGIESRGNLIIQSRDIFNNEGLQLTLSHLAKSLEISLGKLTYHFPTKDHLFIAIAKEYQIQMLATSQSIDDGPFNMKVLYEITDRLLDLQYDFRCVIRYVAAAASFQSDLYAHITENYRNDKVRILGMIQLLVANGELNESILEETNYNVFLFCMTNLFTTWLINLEIYDIHQPYASLKPIYLKGIFTSYLPYLTPKGFGILKPTGIF